MKRFLIKFLFPVVRVYWFLFRPKTFGAKCVIENNGKILMVKHTYGNVGWAFPGGSIKKGETPEKAVAREIKEEAGIEIFDLKLIGSFLTNAEYKKDTVYCFSARSAKTNLKIGADEIAEAEWFSLNDIPSSLTPFARKILSLYISNSRE